MTRYVIAVGFDGSPDAELALRWALDFAKTGDADVHVVHAMGLLEHSHAPYSRKETPEGVLGVVRSIGFDPARVHWHVDDGDPCSVLLRAIAEPIGATLLVVGSRGRGQRPELLLGSTSLEVAEHSSVPVVIVPSRRRDPFEDPSADGP